MNIHNESDNDIMVSMCSVSYNHEAYIKECLESFLMQKTNFKFEIIIYDDASTDNTPNILKEYQAKYPDIIKLILSKENQYSQGVCTFRYPFDQAKGKYISLCEGDDFLTDPQKIQIQFDLMEQNPDCSLSMHGCYFLNCLAKKYVPKRCGKELEIYDGTEFAHKIVLRNTPYRIQSTFFRRESYLKIRDSFIRDTDGAPMGDVQILFHLALVGNVCCLSRLMSTYRKAANSISSFNNPAKHEEFAKKSHAYVKQMVLNSGYPEWADEFDAKNQRSKKRNKSKFYVIFKKNIRKLDVLNLFVLKHRINYIRYINSSPEKRCRILKNVPYQS